MLTKLLRPTLWLAMIAVALALAADIAYFAHGSLELFPTDEQQDTVREVTAVIGALLPAVAIGLWSLLRRLGPQGVPNETPQAGATPLPEVRDVRSSTSSRER